MNINLKFSIAAEILRLYLHGKVRLEYSMNANKLDNAFTDIISRFSHSYDFVFLINICFNSKKSLIQPDADNRTPSET